jgi:transcriptional adapter 3
MEDFSKLKQPQQVVVNTFYSSIEPWIRNIKEEDIGFLEFTGDEVEPYIMPKLGRHYTDVWEEEDIGLYGGPLPGFSAMRAGSSLGSSSAPTPKWDPSTLSEEDLWNEEKGHGPLTERLLSALLPTPEASGWKGVRAAEEAMEGRPGGSGAAAARKEKMNVSDLEERIRDTMRFYGLLDCIVGIFSVPALVLASSLSSLITPRKWMTRSRQPFDMLNGSSGRLCL